MGVRGMAAVLVLSLGLGAAVAASTPQPDYYPTCGSATDIAPTYAAGGYAIRTRSPVVWNGKDYGVAWVDAGDSRLYFRRFYADGTPVGAATMLSTRVSDSTSAPDMVWNGGGYGIVWAATNPLSKQGIYMVRLDASGVLIPGSETLVGASSGTTDSATPALTWNGSLYFCAYTFKYVANTDHDIYSVIVNGAGAIVASPVIVGITAMQDYPSVAWNPSASGGNFVVAWDDNRGGTQYKIYGNTVSTGGSVGTEMILITPPGTAWARVPCLAVPPAANYIALAYSDQRNTYTEVYFARFDRFLSKIGTEARVVPETVYNAYNPRMAWTGAEFGIVFEDFRSGNRDVWFQAVTPTGVADGTPRQITFSATLQDPALAFARYGWLVTSDGYTTPNYVQAVGCNYVAPPPCPEGALAYNVSGTQATLAWLPSQDPYTDIAYYQVYRNASLVGITDNTAYTDTGLSLSTNYTYSIRAVNAAQYVSSACTATSSVYLKTNATLLLMVAKSASGTDAALSWTDAGLAGYNVFKGTSPQVMSLIGTTGTLSASDSGALSDGVLYFYTVDDPGQ